MSIRLLQGDCREILKTLPDASVHCCVTSPPYFGLRDYGTGTWEGGDPECSHLPRPRSDYGTKSDTNNGSIRGGPFRDQCGKCGAIRADKQIGLEATPDEYIAELVAVFREVKRVLRPDGICFINMGDSYCSAAQGMRYELRDDLSLSELQNVALAVFGVRITGDEAPGQGPVPPVLPSRLHCKPDGGRSEIPSNGVEAELHAPSLCETSEHRRAESSNQAGCDSGIRGQMCLLRGDDAAIPDARSYQRRWSGAPKENGAIDDQNIPTGETRGIPDAQISDPMLQLQLRHRIMGILSARKLTGAEIPTAVRACFKASAELKPKDLLGMPWMLAFALRADGWYLRSDIIWVKPNPMPESCTDRPTSSHEHVFLFAKSGAPTHWVHRDHAGSRTKPSPDYRWVHRTTGYEMDVVPASWDTQEHVRKIWRRVNLWQGRDYFYDADAVREPHTEGTHSRGGVKTSGHDAYVKAGNWNTLPPTMHPSGRNVRNVWTIATSPYSSAHFATFPPKLAERCIKAGSSERGCCAACGAPWVRVVERGAPDLDHQRACGGGEAGEYHGASTKDHAAHGVQDASAVKARILAGMVAKTTTGWAPSCQCVTAIAAAGLLRDTDVVPCTVLDPFAGAGTTGLVADRLGRDAVLIELNPAYQSMATNRITDDCPLFAEIGK